TDNVVSPIAAFFASKNFLLIFTVIFIISLAQPFSSLASLAKSGCFWAVSLDGAWQKSQCTPSAWLKLRMIAINLSWLIFFGRILRFLKPGSSTGGLVNAAAETTTAIIMLITISLRFCCI